MTETAKQGDRVRVTFEGTVSDRGEMVCVIPFGLSLPVCLTPYQASRATIEVLPPEAKPLEVGEVVIWPALRDSGNPCTVRAVYGGSAWVESNLGANYVTGVETVSRPNGIPILPNPPT